MERQMLRFQSSMIRFIAGFSRPKLSLAQQVALPRRFRQTPDGPAARLLRKSLFAAIVLLAAAGAEAADLVVADAHNVTLEPGQLVDGNRPLVLHADQRLTLIAKDGRTIRLRGPYNGRPGAAEAADTTTLFEGIAALRTQTEPRLSQAGVVRSPSLLPELEKAPRRPAP
jgi:hypothetical protein